MNPDKKEKPQWEIDFKHGTYRLMKGKKEIERFQTLADLKRYQAEKEVER